jgi:act minimal PKS acyl carrier protein
MSVTRFTVDDLRRILRERAGVHEGVDLDGQILDLGFEDLGYESLALLEAGGLIEREFGVVLGDEALAEATTPRELIELVNAHLTARL